MKTNNGKQAQRLTNEEPSVKRTGPGQLLKITHSRKIKGASSHSLRLDPNARPRRKERPGGLGWGEEKVEQWSEERGRHWGGGVLRDI